MLDLYHIHPMVVHFPIGLLVVGLGIYMLGIFGQKTWPQSRGMSWLLWGGTIGLAVSLGMGLLAEELAPRVPAAMKTLEQHETLGWSSLTAFTALSLWRVFYPNKGVRAFGLLWMAGAVLLLGAAHWGALLVFRYGVGVVALQP